MKIVETTITEGTSYTDWKFIRAMSYVDYSILGSSFDGTVILERKYESGDTGRTVESWDTTDDEGYFFVASAAYYRLGVGSDYASGTVTVSMSVGEANGT